MGLNTHLADMVTEPEQSLRMMCLFSTAQRIERRRLRSPEEQLIRPTSGNPARLERGKSYDNIMLTGQIR